MQPGRGGMGRRPFCSSSRSVPSTRRSTSLSAPGSASRARWRCDSFSASPTCGRTSRAKADAHLTPFVNLEPDRRLAAQAERTIKVVRSQSFSKEMRPHVRF